MAIWNSFVLFLENVLLFFKDLTGSSGLAIILFTLCARLVIFPITLTSIRSSRRLQELQPLMKELQRKYGKDQQRLTEETMKLYRENKVNPAGGCLPIFLQLPIFLGVYQAVINLTRVPVSEVAAKAMLGVVGNAGVSVSALSASFGQRVLDGGFLWIAELGKPDSWYILPVLSVILQLLVQLMATPRVQDPQQKAMMQSMLLLPIVFGYIGFTFPAGAVLYWVMGSVFSIVQQLVVSGWGSLANYLKFLPADFNGFLPPTTPLAAAAAANAAAVSATPVVDEQAKRTFWDVLAPLGSATPEGSSPADEPARRTAAAANPRQPRSRR